MIFTAIAALIVAAVVALILGLAPAVEHLW